MHIYILYAIILLVYCLCIASLLSHSVPCKEIPLHGKYVFLFYFLYNQVLRYETLGAPGYQASLPGKTFDVLRECFGVQMECFASPLNT
jgi:hypothetical protein